MDRPPHLDIDLNEAPSPQQCETPPPRGFAPPVYAPPPMPQFQPPPPQPAPASQQLLLQQEALEMALQFHRVPEPRNTHFGAIGNVPSGFLPGMGVPPPPPHPGEAGWGHPLRPCASCGHPEILGGTMVCDACDRGFHPSCVRVWPPLMLTPPPPPGPPGARRPRAAANDDWICPECEMRGARSSRWKLGPVPLDINAAPPEDAVMDISRTNVADGAQLSEFSQQLPHLEGVHLKNIALYNGMQFMPSFDLAHCLGMRQKFTSMDRDITADGNVPHRSIHLRRRRSLPQTSTLPMFAENHEFGTASIFMDPSFFTKAMEPSPSENRSSLKPPKFLVENSNHRSHHRTVGLPVQYSDFFITCLGEIDNRTSYHNSYQIWPVGFTSYWHDKITGSLFECEVCDGGNFGPLFKVRRLPCSVFPLPDASTTLCRNVVRKADTIETKESSSLIEDTANDTDDNIFMLLSEPSEVNQDFLSCLSNDMEGKRTLGCSNIPGSYMTMPTIPSHSGAFSSAPTKEVNLHDKIGEFTFEGTSPSSVWRMISCAMTEACEKMYKEHGHLVFFCTHSSEKPSFDYGSGSQNTDGPCNPLTRFCSSYGPSILQFIEKENDAESTCALLKEWLYQDRIGFDMEFVQEIVESLPKSRACSNYQFLCNRDGFVSSLTVASGTLLSVHKNSPSNGDTMSYGRHGSVVSGPQDRAQPRSLSIRELPRGNPISCKLPPELAGDVFQILEFLGRFAEIVGLKEAPSIEQVEDELIDPWPICANQKDIQHYRDHTPPTNSPANVSTSHSNGESGLTTNEEIAPVFIPVETSSTREATQDNLAAQTLGRCSGVVLPEIHLALLRVLFSELLSKVAIFVDPSIDPKESKSKRGRKRDADNATKDLKIDMLTANKLTWPELSRRYILAVSSMSGCMDLSDISSREGVKLFRCLQGDGGILCGAFPGVVGMEKDALLLAEAENLIYNSSADEGNKVFMMDFKDTDVVDSPEEPASDINTLPDWVESLEPVRKLPTNVGTRIRKCVYEALERKPPEWARKILEHSISKEVYKGNASGPTKKAVLSVLTEACRVKVPQNPEKPRKQKNIISISEAIMKKCRIALRRAISSDESKLFGNLLGTTLTNSNENEDEGILGFPGMVSRPLDFRTIDIRLAMGAYRGSWEAFRDDVQEVICNLHTAFGDRPDVLEMVVALSQSFESLYKTEVLDVVEKFDKYLCNKDDDSELNEELLDILTAANNMPKAPWEDGVCKVCGIDRDDDSVLLCDKCDSEYHTYCLNPPLARIPEGNWYCPSCVAGRKRAHPDHNVADLMREQKKHVGEESHAFYDAVNKLAMAMEEKEYWELSIPERIYLLKFLCDEMLNTALIREHLDQCSDKSVDLQQKFRSWNYELKELKYKVEIRTSCARQGRWIKNEHLGNSSGLGENQQRGMPTASDHLEESEQVNVGVNLNNPADGAPAGQLNVGRPYKTDNDISSASLIEGNTSLGLSKQPSGITTDRIDGDAIGEGFQSCEKSLGSTSCTYDNLNMRESHLTTVISSPNGELPDKNASRSFQDNLEASTTTVVDHDADNNEMKILLDRISQLQDSISTVESQLTMASLRRDCLGRDLVGRLYWVIARPGKRPWLVADGSMLIPKYRDISMVSSYPQSTFDCRGWNSASVVMYESDEEIKCLVDWLRDYEPREKELKDSILLWQRLNLQASFPLSDPPASKFSKIGPLIDLPHTKAFVILEQKYGLQLDQDTSDLSKRRGKKTKSGSEERTYRCDCLEPIWPSRYHCLTCHETYLTSTEYEEHNGGKCNRSNHSRNESKENDEPKVKGIKSDTKEKDPADHNCSIDPSSNRKLEPCPYDFEEICRKFVTNDSNTETVKEIGLIGSNGVPSFVPSPAFFFEPPVVLSQNKRYDDMPNDWTSSLEECQAMSAKKNGLEESKSGQDCPGNAGEEQMPKSRKPVRDSTSGEETSSARGKPTRLLAVNGGLVPESSLRPVIGRNSHILKQLKINLLDVDAALPEEALRASKSQQIRRRSWRAFVKDAESISQVVLATILLESMIKAEFLKNNWWYWSSFTAAIKTATVSSLALRIYTLDDCIIYTKDHVPNTEPADGGKPVNKGKRKKEGESSAS
ncbi:methyl-CpG-binding domain-containing protein 9-like isoform X2 [Phragmites australis]|uniref:methyl-CpG-binding domain-containing protein 9-like isoform X2 n=1 Tax=Phragmites australis TaxID=29695 RepID=UPI002D77CDDF|nr:methyl-CpG-binding domain-containing protein 9-like isoform X2 [Phragmites australis]